MLLKASLAGSFYPANKEQLERDIKDYLDKVDKGVSSKQILGIISPHAGYYYSGQCAAYGFKALQKVDFNRVIVIAPCHRYRGFDYSIGDFDSLHTPLGDLKIDVEIVSKLLEIEGFESLPDVYIGENAFETQLPFIAYIKPSVKVVPILLGNQSMESSIKLANHLNDVFDKDFSGTVIVASSDLSHYYNSNIAEVLDSNLIELVENNELSQLDTALQEGEVEARGIGPVMTLMKLAELQNHQNTEILNYTHSGQISGEQQQVVGYVSIAFAK